MALERNLRENEFQTVLAYVLMQWTPVFLGTAVIRNIRQPDLNVRANECKRNDWWDLIVITMPVFRAWNVSTELTKHRQST